MKEGVYPVAAETLLQRWLLLRRGTVVLLAEVRLYVKESSADVIAMSTHGRSGMAC